MVNVWLNKYAIFLKFVPNIAPPYSMRKMQKAVTTLLHTTKRLRTRYHKPLI